jgi:hypothetical protein
MLNKIPGNMWTLSQFKSYLNQQFRQNFPAEKEPIKEEDEVSNDGEREESVANFDDAEDDDDDQFDRESQEEVSRIEGPDSPCAKEVKEEQQAESPTDKMNDYWDTHMLP